MLARSENPGPVARAFTLFEVLIVLALLIGVSAVVLPAVLDRGLADLRDDTRLRLNAALLDAQREARRTGQTIEVSLRTDANGKNSEILILAMPTTTRSGSFDAGDFAADAESWWGTDTDTATADPTNESDAATDWAGPDSASTVTLGYALPDGTIVPAGEGLVLQMDRGSFEMTIDAGSATVRLTATNTEEPDASSTPAAEDEIAEDDLDGWEP